MAIVNKNMDMESPSRFAVDHLWEEERIYRHVGDMQEEWDDDWVYVGGKVSRVEGWEQVRDRAVHDEPGDEVCQHLLVPQQGHHVPHLSSYKSSVLV